MNASSRAELELVRQALTRAKAVLLHPKGDCGEEAGKALQDAVTRLRASAALRAETPRDLELYRCLVDIRSEIEALASLLTGLRQLWADRFAGQLGQNYGADGTLAAESRAVHMSEAG